MVRAVGGAAGRVGDLDSGLFSAQRVELSQSRFSKGSAGNTRSWMGATAGGWLQVSGCSSPQSQAHPGALCPGEWGLLLGFVQRRHQDDQGDGASSAVRTN